MTNQVYQAWLTDRGLISPGSQPYHLLQSSIDPNASCCVLAAVEPDSAPELLTGISRLSIALKAPGRLVSWVAFAADGTPPDLKILRSMMPQLSRVIHLTSLALPSTALTSFPIEATTVASRPIHLIYGPSMALMNQEPQIKRQFWEQLRSWMAGGAIG